MPQPKKSTLIDRAKTVSEVTAAVGGILGLIEKIVQVWQGLAFGAGPEMPADYKYLAKELSSPWGSSMPSRYAPANINATSVNWELARAIYNRAHALLLTPAVAAAGQNLETALLEKEAAELVGSLPPQFQRTLLELLGESEESDA